MMLASETHSPRRAEFLGQPNSRISSTGAVVRNFSKVPRLSIVVPHGGDDSAFEASLVSVLQHRPDGCEVIVPHDGTYDDPFELSDEVHLVNTQSTSLIRQITEATDLALGRFVHVIADGHTATADWTEAALAQFESHETGIVIPVVRHPLTDLVEHAGWRNSARSACDLVGHTTDQIAKSSAVRVQGAFLGASFWRRDLLRCLSGSYRENDTIEASMTYGLMAAQGGWRHVIAADSTMSFDDETTEVSYADRVDRNHRRLQAIADQFATGGSTGWGRGLQRLVTTAFAGGCKPASLASAVRRTCIEHGLRARGHRQPRNDSHANAATRIESPRGLIGQRHLCP